MNAYVCLLPDAYMLTYCPFRVGGRNWLEVQHVVKPEMFESEDKARTYGVYQVLLFQKEHLTSDRNITKTAAQKSQEQSQIKAFTSFIHKYDEALKTLT